MISQSAITFENTLIMSEEGYENAITKPGFHDVKARDVGHGGLPNLKMMMKMAANKAGRVTQMEAAEMRESTHSEDVRR